MTADRDEPWPISETVVDGLTERLRQAVITGIIRPSERIRVADLEKQFGVSHIPIREALRRLQSEGLVEISPRRTTIAAGVDLQDLADVYDLRLIIEIEIGRRAVSRMTASNIDAVRFALERFQAVARDPSSAAFWERHREFHWALLSPAANPTIRRVLDRLWQTSERYVRLFVSTFATMQTVMDLHVELYEACAGGDATTFEQALTRHYTETEKTVREGFRSLQAIGTNKSEIITKHLSPQKSKRPTGKPLLVRGDAQETKKLHNLQRTFGRGASLKKTARQGRAR